VIYEAYSNLLLEKTRDHMKFHLIFDELVHYGFRRNLWELKPIALPIVSACALGEFVSIVIGHRAHNPVPTMTIVSILLHVLLFVSWVWIINTDWVRRSAESYADHLLAALESLDTGAARRRKKPAQSRNDD
jgi:hypothetical protein